MELVTLAASSAAWFGAFLVLGVLGWLSSNSAFEGFAAALIVVGLLHLAYTIFS